MKTVKDKYLVVGADFAGFPLKEIVVEHLEKKGWKILDLGVKKDSDPNDTDLSARILRNGYGNTHSGE